MDCSLVEEELSAYIDNELEPEGRLRVEAHLAECDWCASEVGAQRAAKGLVSRLRRYEEHPPETLHLLPLPVGSMRATARLAWLRRPLGRTPVWLAAAAVLAGLLVSYHRYERQFILRGEQRDLVAAHLQGAATVLLREPGAELTVAQRQIPPVSEGDVYAVPHGTTSVGRRVALHTIYLIGPHTVSQLRFPAGDFDDRGLTPRTVHGRTYRLGQVGAFSVASYWYGSAQVVLVTVGSPEALLAFAQNIPPDTPFGPADVGY